LHLAKTDQCGRLLSLAQQSLGILQHAIIRGVKLILRVGMDHQRDGQQSGTYCREKSFHSGHEYRESRRLAIRLPQENAPNPLPQPPPPDSHSQPPHPSAEGLPALIRCPASSSFIVFYSHSFTFLPPNLAGDLGHPLSMAPFSEK